jgi:hypothetical protein
VAWRSKPDDARRFVASPLPDRCRRVLIAPLDPDPKTALQDAAAMEVILADAGLALPQVHHGFDASCWPVITRALERRNGISTGMEAVVILPGGQPVKDNIRPVMAARSLINGIARCA